MNNKREEAYFLGCLFMRGRISYSNTRREHGKAWGKYTIRVPVYKIYSPLSVELVKFLQEKEEGVKSKTIYEQFKAFSSDISPRLIGKYLSKIKKWKPSGLQPNKTMLEKTAEGIWKISDDELVERYLDWQHKYQKQDYEAMKFVWNHLQETFSAFSNSFEISTIQREEGYFNMKYHVLSFEVPPLLFEKFNHEYGLEIGDIYRHIRMPKTIYTFSKEELLEFFRGMADISVHFDQAPRYYGNMKKGLWQMRFGVLSDNPRFAVETCNLIQNNLKVPVLSINWAELTNIEGIKTAGFKYRGKRDIHIIVFCYNVYMCLTKRPFYHEWKLREFNEHIKEDLVTIKGVKNLSILDFCPRKKPAKHAKICKKLGCKRTFVPKDNLSLNSF